MANFVATNKKALKKRHYVLLANQAGHWFNAYPNVLERYERRFGDDFCVVLYKDGPADNAYVLPYSAIKHILTDDNLMPSGENSFRWVGSIRYGRLDMRKINKTVPVQQYHNAFDLL